MPDMSAHHNLALLIAAPQPGETTMLRDQAAMAEALLARGLAADQILCLHGPLDRLRALAFLHAAGRRVADWQEGAVFLHVSGHGFFHGNTAEEARPGLLFGEDEQTLLDRTQAEGDLSVLGALCDLANEATPHAKFRRIIARCVPHPGLEPFFSSVARSPLAARLARENALDVFLRWNYWCAEVRYLNPVTTAARQPARWGGCRLPGPGKRLGRLVKERPGCRRLLALWCTEEEWNRLLQHLPADTRARYQALATFVTAHTANDSDAQAPRAAGLMR